MAYSIKFMALVCLIVCFAASTSKAQLAFHTDTNTNSFTLKAPGVQQTFTRYFGGQQGGLLQAQSTQRQQVVQSPQSLSYQQPTQQALQSAYAAFQQQDQQFQAAQQQSQAQSQYLSAQEYATYLQQIQAAQAAQQQYQQTQFAAGQQQQQPQKAAPQSAPLGASPEALRQNNLLGVAYSPSNQVSHVKFSSGGLAYNF